MVSVQDICSLSSCRTEPDSMLESTGQGREAGSVPGQGAGKSAGSDKDLSLSHTPAALQGDPWLLPVYWEKVSGSSLFSKLQPGMDTWASWGKCQWRWVMAACMGQSVFCVFSLNHLHHSPKCMSLSIAIPVGAAGTHVFPEMDQRGPWSWSHRFLSCAPISSKLSLCQWPQMLWNKAVSITKIFHQKYQRQKQPNFTTSSITFGGSCCFDKLLLHTVYGWVSCVFIQKEDRFVIQVVGVLQFK